MKKLFLSLALVVASMGMATASNLSTDMVSSYDAVSVYSNVDGVYTGTATPTKMNGQPVQNPTPVSAVFTIEGGFLDGSVTVATAGHSFNFSSEEEITGPGTYAVAGSFYVNSMISLPLTGEIVITTVNGSDLEFTCTAYVNGSAATESVFSFTTN